MIHLLLLLGLFIESFELIKRCWRDNDFWFFQQRFIIKIHVHQFFQSLFHWNRIVFFFKRIEVNQVLSHHDSSHWLWTSFRTFIFYQLIKSFSFKIINLDHNRIWFSLQIFMKILKIIFIWLRIIVINQQFLLFKLIWNNLISRLNDNFLMRDSFLLIGHNLMNFGLHWGIHFKVFRISHVSSK